MTATSDAYPDSCGGLETLGGPRHCNGTIQWSPLRVNGVTGVLSAYMNDACKKSHLLSKSVPSTMLGTNKLRQNKNTGSDGPCRPRLPRVPPVRFASVRGTFALLDRGPDSTSLWPDLLQLELLHVVLERHGKQARQVLVLGRPILCRAGTKLDVAFFKKIPNLGDAHEPDGRTKTPRLREHCDTARVIRQSNASEVTLNRYERAYRGGLPHEQL